MDKPKKIFVDNCIFSLACVLEPATKTVFTPWGNREKETVIAGLKAKPLPSADWKRLQLEALPTINKLALDGTLKLMSYCEVQHEGWRKRGSFNAALTRDLFDGTAITKVKAAIERSFFFQVSFDEMLRNQSMISYCKWLIDADPEALLRSSPDSLPAFMRENIRDLKRFSGSL